MAKTITRWLISDLSGERVLEAEGTALSFQLDGTSYVIDLTRREANLLRAKLGPFTNGARKAQKAREREQVLATQRKRLAKKQAEKKRLEQKQAAEAEKVAQTTPPTPVTARVEEPAAPPVAHEESRDWPQPTPDTLFDGPPPALSASQVKSGNSVSLITTSSASGDVEGVDDSPVERTPIDAMPDYENEGEDMETPVAPLATNLFQAPPAIAMGARPDVTLKRVPADPQTVRVWAQHHGIRVPQRGRIPDEVMEAFDRSQAERQSNAALPGGTRQETPKRQAPVVDPGALFAAPGV